MSEKGLKVTVEDLDAGTKDVAYVPMHEYFLVTTGACELTHTQVYPSRGTHVLTIKGRRAAQETQE